MSRLVRVQFADLRSGLLVAKADLRVYEVLVADQVQAIMIKNKHTAVVITATEFNKNDWYTSTKGTTRRRHGQG